MQVLIMRFGFIVILTSDDWLLYAMDSPSASNSRGFSRGSIFNKKGELIASVAQEGLISELIKK